MNLGFDVFLYEKREFVEKSCQKLETCPYDPTEVQCTMVRVRAITKSPQAVGAPQRWLERYYFQFQETVC